MPFTIKENNTGPRTVPYGTPLFILTNSVVKPSTATLCFRSLRKLIIELTKGLNDLSLLQTRSCGSLSKALEKSNEKTRTKSMSSSSHLGQIW